MPPVYFPVIPAVFKPESRPPPNKVLRMMDSYKELAGMTACECSDKLLASRSTGPRIRKLSTAVAAKGKPVPIRRGRERHSVIERPPVFPDVAKTIIDEARFRRGQFELMV